MNASGGDGTGGTTGGSVVREESVEVEKTHETDRFPVPAVVLSIRSERDEAVEVRLADRVPEGVSMDDIGFHPEYGSEYWSVEGRTLVFERELGGNDEIETVYGLRGPDAEEADRFLADPTIEVWTGGESESSFVEDINDKLTRSATFADDGENGERGATAGSEDTAETPGVIGGDAGDDDWTEEFDTSDADERGEGDETDETDDSEGTAIEYGIEEGRIEKIEGDAGDDGRSDDGGRDTEDATTTENASMDGDTPNDGETHETSTGDGATTDAIAAQLARELRTGDVDSEDREILREVLSPRESVSARIDHLRSQVNDVAAYADALEAFLDENGSGRTLIRQHGERLDALREDVETVTERAGANRTNVEQVESDVERVESDVDAFQAAISDLDEEIERIDDRLASIDERAEESEARSTAVSEHLDGVESRQEEITERLDALEANHESDMADLREDIGEQVDERITSVERSTEAVETDVEALEAWRAQLAGALGGARPGSGAAEPEESESDDASEESG